MNPSLNICNRYEFCNLSTFVKVFSGNYTTNSALGDVVLTGTPAGVGPVQDGDVIEGEISGIVHFKFPVVQRI